MDGMTSREAFDGRNGNFRFGADAIKEALNTGAATPGNKGTTPNS